MEARPPLLAPGRRGQQGLSVTLAGRTYVLGLMPRSLPMVREMETQIRVLLKDGVYDIVVETTNTVGRPLAYVND